MNNSNCVRSLVMDSSVPRMAEHAVIVAGGGPTGLMLAGELALAGVDVAIVEQRNGSEGLIGSRAGGMTSRTLEVLDQRGIAGRFLSQGWVGQLAHFSRIFLDVADLPTRQTTGWGCRNIASNAS